MRVIIVAMVAIMSSIALADDVDEAHRRAVSGRDSYWNCLARQYQQQDNRNMSGPDFTSLIPAHVLPSGRIFGCLCWITCRCNSLMSMPGHI